MAKIFKILTPDGKTPSLLKTEAKERAIRQARVISERGIQDSFKQKQGLFKIKDYQLTKELKDIRTSLRAAGVKNTSPLVKSILNFRMAVDNMSGKLLQGGSLSKEAAETIESQLGSYLTREYKQYNRLNPLKNGK